MKKYILPLLMLFFVFNIYAVEGLNLSDFFNEDQKTAVDSGEIFNRIYIKYNAVNENTDEFIELPVSDLIDNEVRDYEMIVDERAFIPYDIETQGKLNILKQLTSYSKLKGMPYYSRKIGQVQEFIVDAYTLDPEKHSKQIEDPVYSDIPAVVENYFLQQDNKFGKLKFKSTVRNYGDDFVIENVCIQPLQKFIIQVAKKEEYRYMSFYIYDHEKKGYYYYAFVAVRVRLDNVLKNGRVYPSSFANRLRASTVRIVKLIGLDWSDKLNSTGFLDK